MESINLSSLDLPQKEKKILAAAIKVFSQKGFSAATTNEIAKSAGVAEGTIFRYFKTKKDILRGILIQTINLMSSAFLFPSIEKIFAEAEGKELKDVIKEVLYDRLKLMDKIFPMASVIFTEALHHEDVREALYQNIIAKGLEMFRPFHKKLMEKGMIRSNIEPETMIRSILGNIAVFIIQRKLFSDKFDFEDIDKEFDKIIDILLYGISAKRQE